MNPYGIEQVDLPGVYGAVHSARMGRLQQMMLNRQIEHADRQAERDNQFNSVLARVYGGGQSGGKEGSTPSAPTRRPSVNAPYMVSPDTPLVSPTTTAPSGPIASPQMPTQGAPSLSPELTRQLIAIDPQRGAQIAAALRQADEATLARVTGATEEIARLGQHLLDRVPEAEWAAEIQRRAPALMAHGVTQAQIDEVVRDPSRRNILYHIGEARDVEKLIEDAHPHLRNVSAGDVIIDEANPGGEPVYESPYVPGPNGTMYPRPPAMSAHPPQPLTDEDIRRMEGGAGSQGPRTFR